jgi:Tfp pilus assembly protein PilX
MTYPRRQQGITLVTALIMLLLLTMLALASVNLGNSNLQVVGNMQRRDQALSAARSVLEETISTAKFTTTPGAALSNPCGAPNSRCVDTDGDGRTDVKVTLTPPPACLKVQPIKNTDLDMSNAEDAGCSDGAAQAYGVSGATDGNSECDNSVWDVTAVATDTATQTSVKVVQGVSVRVGKDEIATNCPQPGASP